MRIKVYKTVIKREKKPEMTRPLLDSQRLMIVKLKSRVDVYLDICVGTVPMNCLEEVCVQSVNNKKNRENVIILHYFFTIHLCNVLKLYFQDREYVM